MLCYVTSRWQRKPAAIHCPLSLHCTQLTGMTQPTNLNHNLSVVRPLIHTHIRPNTPSAVSNQVTSSLLICSPADFWGLIQTHSWILASSFFTVCYFFYFKLEKLQPGFVTFNLTVPIYFAFSKHDRVEGEKRKEVVLFASSVSVYSHTACWASPLRPAQQSVHITEVEDVDNEFSKS